MASSPVSAGLMVTGLAIALVAGGMGLQRALERPGAAVAATAPADRLAGDLIGSTRQASGDAAGSQQAGSAGAQTHAAGGGSGINIHGAKPPPLAASDKRAAAAIAVHIPRLKIDQSLIKLHELADQSLSVPTDFSDIGWWPGGPHPGGPGATLIAGHVSSQDGPAVFYRLKDLRTGDHVTVDRADKTSAVFEVVGKASYPRSDFPDDVVYRTTGKPSIHLVTCDGTFDTAIGHHEDNLVVFADLVSTGPTKKAHS